MGYTHAPPGSRLFLDFTRDQFCGKVLDRSGMCGEPAVLGGVPPIWKPDGLQFASSNCVLKNNSNIDIVSASQLRPVIWWFDMQLIEPRVNGWFFRKAFEPNSIASQYGFYMADSSYIQVSVNGASANLDITSNVYSKKERFFLSVFWDGEKIYGYINGKLLAQNTLVTTIPSGGYLCVGSRDPDSSSYFDGNIFQCGITVGASIAELHEWYRKWHKTGNLHTSVVAMQSETLPDSALDSTIMLKR